MAEVKVQIVRFSKNDQASIKLFDAEELFAECPVSLPLFTCVEPVIDSSRYFVVRVVDPESGRHVFLGLGFREREEASNFNAALAEHQSYLERKEAALSMRKEFDNAYKEDEELDTVGELPKQQKIKTDFSLKPGEKLHLKLGGNGNSGSSISGTGFLSKKLTKTFSLVFDPKNGGAAVAALAPPPPSRGGLSKPTMDISPSHSAGVTEKKVEWGEFEAAEQEEH
jgi:hypothetical protein